MRAKQGKVKRGEVQVLYQFENNPRQVKPCLLGLAVLGFRYYARPH